MKEDMFDVLMYLFEHYYMDEETELSPDRDSLHSELVEAGFPSNDINQAFEWLEGLSVQQHQMQAPQAENAIRIYSALECERLDAESRGFLLFLEQMGILPPDARERVIERVMALETDDFDLSQLKWVILMVLFNQPGAEAAYAWMEDLVFESLPGGYLH
jgi:Smg protein